MDEKLTEHDFGHIQRVLSDSSSTQTSVMNTVLGFQSVGLVGLYTIKDDHGLVLILLPIVMLLITTILGIVWQRESELACQFTKKIEKHVWKPQSNWWTGKTMYMWAIVHIGGFLFWFSIFILAISGCLNHILCEL